MQAESGSRSRYYSSDEWEELTRKPHVPLCTLLLSYADCLRPLGLIDPGAQRLGAGAFGCAYRVNLRGRDGVLKLTRDPYEVMAAAAVRGQTLHRVVPVHEIWALSSTCVYPHWAPWFAVHRDYLKPLSAKDAELIEFLYDMLHEEHLDLWIPKVGKAGRVMREQWRTMVREGYVHERHGKHVVRQGYPGKEGTRALQLLDEISLGVAELAKHGIDWTDMHSDNVMRDMKGVLRIADIGFGRPNRDFDDTPESLSPDLAIGYARG